MGFDLADTYKHRNFFEDVKTRTPDGAHAFVPGSVRAGALLHVPPGRPEECGGSPVRDLPPWDVRDRASTTATPLCVVVVTRGTDRVCQAVRACLLCTVLRSTR